MVIKEADFIDSKPVQNYVWDGTKPVRVKGTSDGAVATSDEIAQSTLAIMRQMLHLLKPLGIVTGAGSNRLQTDIYNIATGTLASVTTVGTITNVRDIGTIPNGGFQHMKDMSTAAFQSLRSNIV